MQSARLRIALLLSSLLALALSSPTRAQRLDRGDAVLVELDVEERAQLRESALPELEALAGDELAPVLDEDGVVIDEEVAREAPEPDAPDLSEAEPISLPVGTARTAVTADALSLPAGEGSIEGMGDSFSPSLSYGTATYSVPIAVVPGRAGLAPQLSLSYASSGGSGELGMGWSLGLPSIQRQLDRGLPRYVDGASWHPEEDRFTYGEAGELVPVSSAAIGALDGGTIPAELSGWQQYRARIEGGFARIFRAPDSTRWVVQRPDGSRLDFGLLPAGEGPSEAVAASAAALVRSPRDGRVFRWHLVRIADAHGSTLWATYTQHEGHAYLDAIHYVSPASCGALSVATRHRCTASLSDYAARVRFVWEGRPDVITSYLSGFRIRLARRLRRLEITAAGVSLGARTLVRRYHFAYEPRSHHSLLASVTVEGRPERDDAAAGVRVGDDTIAETALGEGLVGTTLPPLRFRYTGDALLARGSDGFPALDGTLHRAGGSPLATLGDQRTELFDVNADGLPDVIVTDPLRHRTADGQPAVGVYWNGFTGRSAQPGTAGSFSAATPTAIDPRVADVLRLSRASIVPMDVDGDGRSDFLHVPRASQYGWFAPVRQPGDLVTPVAQAWRFAYLPVELPDADADPRIDLDRDAERVRVLDVNGDHLVDVLRTSGTAIQTWLNLGSYVGGEGRFGHATHDGTRWLLSTEPVETCLPIAGAPLSFEDPEVQLADMNGDGLVDIARIAPGRVAYWPSRGHGLFGDGDGECPAGATPIRPLEMSTPRDLGAELDGIRLADVDGDGTADLVAVTEGSISVWLNADGASFAPRTRIDGLRWGREALRAVRIVDIDGSGTPDVLLGASRGYEWVDPMGGVRARMLREVDNGLGALTTLEYGSSAEDYLRDLAAASGAPASDRFLWQGRTDGCDQLVMQASGECLVRAAGSPVISSVVRRVRVRDRFDVLGMDPGVIETEYRYHDGYYEGIEQELRGFGAADVIAPGGVGHGTSITRTRMHQGQRPSAIAAIRTAQSPWEALKGRTFLVEQADDTGVYASQTHTAWRLRVLATGLDGREIVWAFPARTDSIRYDTAAFVAAPAGATVPSVGSGGDSFAAVLRERVSASGAVSVDPVYSGWAHTVPLRGTRYAIVASTTDVVDHAGHVRESTAWGRVRGEFAEALPAEEIVTHREPVLLDPARWLWAVSDEWTSGHGSTERLRWTTRTLDASTGDALVTTTHVSIPRAYAFAGDADGSAAYTQVAEDLVASSALDPWGQPIRACMGADLRAGDAGCLRLTDVTRDPAYQQLAIESGTATLRSGSALTRLASSATFDRGLGLTTSITAPGARVSSVRVDGLGRVVASFAPNVRGCSGSVPLERIRYELTPNADLEPISRITRTDELSCAALGAETRTTHVYVDGLGRARATLETAEAPHHWVRSGVVLHDGRGNVFRTFEPDFVDVSALDYEWVLRPRTASVATGRDAFGRTRYTEAQDYARTWTSYGPLTVNVCDPNQSSASSPFYGRCTTTRTDGHGRTIDTILRNASAEGVSAGFFRLWPTYRADGALVALDRAETTDDAPLPVAREHVVPGRSTGRTFALDSAGRRIASTDADTDARRSGATVADRTWRYLFNRAGDLAAVRDPRGCGLNFYYDLAGRMLAEDYVACTEAHVHPEPSDETAPAGAIGMAPLTASRRVDVRSYYDGYPAWSVGELAVPTDAASALGMLTATSDRGARTVLAYDARGIAFRTARQIAVLHARGLAPSALSAALPSVSGEPAAATPQRRFDETHTYVSETRVDHASRARALDLPRDPDWSGSGLAPRVGGRVSYGGRGLPERLDLAIDTARSPILSSAVYERDGQLAEARWGDGSTVSRTAYDVRRRPIRLTTTRTPTAPHSTLRSLAEVSVVMDQELAWDAADNLTDVYDRRPASEWPNGSRPQSVHITHDALYRVVGADYTYSTDAGPSTLDAALDHRGALIRASEVDPLGAVPAASVAGVLPTRVVSLTWDVDWLGNVTEQTDDLHAFHERSLGQITNGASETAGRPSALRLAADLPTSTHPYVAATVRGGWLEVDYGDSGNVAAVTVHGQCRDASAAQVCWDDTTRDLATRRSSLRTRCTCGVEQHYQYRWDEANRIVDARRYDRPGAGNWSLGAHRRYAYDSGDQRVISEIRNGTSSRYALFVLGGDYERRGLALSVGGVYSAIPGVTETQYLVGGARVVWEGGDPLAGIDANHRVTLPIPDLLGTSSAVIELRTDELLEVSTYLPNGARETLVTTERANLPIEPMGFTGKEADEDVGITYFGMRWLMPHLGRWASPDPLQIHAEGGGESLNNYHYVSGNLLQARDPNGLDETDVVAVNDPEDAPTGYVDPDTGQWRCYCTVVEAAPDPLPRSGLGFGDAARLDEPDWSTPVSAGVKLATGMPRTFNSLQKFSNRALGLGADRLALGLARVHGALLPVTDYRFTQSLYRYSLSRPLLNHWSGGGAVFDLGARMLGAPEPITDVTGAWAETNAPAAVFGGWQSLLGLGGDVARHGVERGVETSFVKNLSGSRTGIIQGWSLIGHSIFNWDDDRVAQMMTSYEAETGQYGSLVQAGNYWGQHGVIGGAKAFGREAWGLVKSWF